MRFDCDNQLLSDFAKCEAKGIVRHIFGYRSKADKIAADMGNVFHRALELHFQGHNPTVVLDRLDVEYNKVFPPGQAADEPRFAKVNVYKIMERYCQIRGREKFPFDVIETEQVKGYMLDYDGKGEILFWTKRDVLVRDRQSGVLKPVDHKTTTKIGDWFAKRHRITSQLSGYCWLTGIEFRQQVGEAYINAIEISKLPDSTGKCKLHNTTYNKCGPEHANFQLYTYTRTPEQIEKWRQDAIIWAQKVMMLKQAFTRLEMLPYAWKSGAFNDSCQFCEYQAWCSVGFPPEKVEEYCTWEPWEPWREGFYITPGGGNQQLWGVSEGARAKHQMEYAEAARRIALAGQGGEERR